MCEGDVEAARQPRRGAQRAPIPDPDWSTEGARHTGVGRTQGALRWVTNWTGGGGVGTCRRDALRAQRKPAERKQGQRRRRGMRGKSQQGSLLSPAADNIYIVGRV